MHEGMRHLLENTIWKGWQKRQFKKFHSISPKWKYDKQASRQFQTTSIFFDDTKIDIFLQECEIKCTYLLSHYNFCLCFVLVISSCRQTDPAMYKNTFDMNDWQENFTW